MGRSKAVSIRITVSYSGSQIAIYAYDETSGNSVSEIVQREDPRAKDLEAIKTALARRGLSVLIHL